MKLGRFRYRTSELLRGSLKSHPSCLTDIALHSGSVVHLEVGLHYCSQKAKNLQSYNLNHRRGTPVTVIYVTTIRQSQHHRLEAAAGGRGFCVIDDRPSASQGSPGGPSTVLKRGHVQCTITLRVQGPGTQNDERLHIGVLWTLAKKACVEDHKPFQRSFSP